MGHRNPRGYPPPNPSGLCLCGCGRTTPVAKCSNGRSQVIGEHTRYCHGHAKRNTGLPHRGVRGYVMISMPDHPNAAANGKVYEHVLVASRAMGKPLPKGAVVHHVNGLRWDNRPENLVVCQDESYHKLLHKRMRQLGRDVSGLWRKALAEEGAA